jgi:2-amino-4-hydroxy-6-hydroxymethyldihydropteridine diphosphokinase
METNTLLLLGSNLGDRAMNLRKSSELLSEMAGEILSRSSIYETEPWNMDEASWFLNQVILIKTAKSPRALMSQIESIESQMGRKTNPSKVNYESRIIDIDILYMSTIILNEPGLNIPHPRLHLRKFTLIPLCEIAPNFIHPVFLKTQIQLLEECADSGITKEYIQ